MINKNPFNVFARFSLKPRGEVSLAHCSQGKAENLTSVMIKNQYG